MNDIPWYGWLFIVLLATILFATNWSLISALRSKNKKSSGPSTAKLVKQMGQTIRNPFQKEDEMLAELSRRTNELREQTSQDDVEEQQDQQYPK